MKFGIKPWSLIREVTEPSAANKYYLIGQKISAGTFSDVFIGFDANDRTESPVAIKRFAYPESLTNVLAASNEVFVLKKCYGSSHVVNCLDHRLCIKDTYVVLEYVPETLHHQIKTGQVDIFLIIAYLWQMPELLADLRDAAVIHADLKPSNVGLKEGKLKALDFGLAKDAGLALHWEDAWIYSPRNVPQYNPPEMREDEENALLTSTCDTYSAGVMLSYLLTGRQVETVRELVKEVKKKRGFALPQSFKKLFAGMTHQKPWGRPRPEELKVMAWEAVRDLSMAGAAGMIPNWGKADAGKINYFGEPVSASSLC